jgi:hypothetical protein
MKCDALGHHISGILMQEGSSLALEMHQLKGKNLLKLIYENEMFVIVCVVNKWHPYLLGRHLKVKIYHDNLNHFLEQQLSLEEHQK